MREAAVARRPAARRAGGAFWRRDIASTAPPFLKGWRVIPVKRGLPFRAYATLKINLDTKHVGDLNKSLAEFGTAKTLPSSGINSNDLTAGFKSGFF